jgi:hypothetical protein
MYRSILVPLDGSPLSEGGIEGPRIRVATILREIRLRVSMLKRRQ